MRLLPRTLTFIVLPIFCQPLSAGLILQPTAVVTNMGQFSSSYPKERVIDKSGLSSTYTSQVTDFDFYIASSPTHSSFTGAGIRWASSSGTPGTPTGNFDFNLGGEFTIESMALLELGRYSFGPAVTRHPGFYLVSRCQRGFFDGSDFGELYGGPKPRWFVARGSLRVHTYRSDPRSNADYFELRFYCYFIRRSRLRDDGDTRTECVAWHPARRAVLVRLLANSEVSAWEWHGFSRNFLITPSSIDCPCPWSASGYL